MKNSKSVVSTKQMKTILKSYHKGMMGQIVTGTSFANIKPGSFNIEADAKKAKMKESTFKNYVAKVHRTVRLSHGMTIAATGAPVPSKHLEVTNEKLAKWNLLK